ncbi:AAA domain-containing protein [Splendidivirga corallicola]
MSNHFIDVHEFDFLNNVPSFEVIEGLIARKLRIPLCSEADSRSEKSNTVSRHLKKLSRVEKFIYEERGSKDLYVGWPFVRGKFSDGTLIRCPLLFFPVSLHLEKNQWILRSRKEVNISLNKSFLLAYTYYNKIKLDEQLLDYSFDDIEDDSRVFRTLLYQLFKDSPIEINFNQENFIDKLINFEDFKKKDFEEKHGNGELKLFPEAVLGIFPQAGSFIVPDYMTLIENNSVPDIEDFFYSRSIDEDRSVGKSYFDVYHFLNKVKEEQTFTPFKMDAFQENALKAVKKGNSVVVQGPPGTGKSQLICNLISDFIARGKRVLMVCQKRAALDVVYKRLEEKGIGDFVALVHDFKNDRKSIYEQIAGQVEKLDEYKQKNNSLDAIQLERKFLQSSRKIDQITEELEEYKATLFDEEECSLSVKELYLTSDIEAPTINLKQEYRFFKFDELDWFIRKLRSYIQYALTFNKPEHPWFKRKSFHDFGLSDLKKMSDMIKGIPGFQEEVSKRTEEIINARPDLRDCEAILHKEAEINRFLEALENPDVYGYFKNMVTSNERDIDLLWLTNTERVLLDCFKGEGPEVSLSSPELGRFQEALQKAIEARKNILKWLKWSLFSKDKFWLKRVMVANDLAYKKKGFETLIEKIDNRLNLEHNLTKIRERSWLTNIPEGFRKADFQTWFFDQKSALAAKTAFTALRNFKEYFNVQALSYEELNKRVISLVDIFKDVVAKKESWQTYLTPFQINDLLEDISRADQLLNSLKKDFDSICEFDSLKAQLLTHEQEVINKLFDTDLENDIDEFIKLFDNSLRLAWIDHIETKFPILRTVSSQKFFQLEQELQQSVEDKLRVSKDILLLKTRERTYEDAEYNRLNNMVTYKELNHQVNKKRRIWPIRKLVTNHYDELFQLVPCWMASPESVSAIFPMQEIFDLVIFDEASQCFAEKGIPAMYRGKQVVIAGDDKQLSPNDLYKVRWEDDEDDLPELEVDSLLDMANQHLMRLQLQGHYRSRSLDLIEFSNNHFYDGNLKLLPDYYDINSQEPAIKFIKVDGIWSNNINDLEARKVVTLIKEQLLSHPEKEIGVVTFNAKQQTHIMDLLDEATSNEGINIPDSLFVKNIENVQGDEKDIIIFSTAYGPDEKGKMIMQFGSLNVVGGENRLNVAITRAKDKIFIVSSVLPHELKVENSKNEGPKLLKKYLQFAKNVSDGKFIPSTISLDQYNTEWFLRNKIKNWSQSDELDVELANELPFTDLTIKINDEYKGLILTDDDLYHQSISVKEAHVYKPFTLHEKHWRYSMFHSRELWQSEEDLKERFVRFLSQLQN